MGNDQLSAVLPDGRLISYAEWGDPGGRPVIYCHGFPASRLEAGLADDPARALGIRLITPDRPGFGRSSHVPGRRMADWPSDLSGFADALGLSRFHVIGVSGGVPYAIACGQQLGARVLGVALVCGLGELVDEASTDGMNPFAATALRFHQRFPRLGRLTYRHLIGPLLRQFPEAIFRIIVGNGTPADRAVLADERVKSVIVRSFTEAFRAGSSGPAHELALMTQAWDVDPTKVAQPVQLWHGEADRTVPVAMGRRHAALLPHVVAHFIPDEGHFSLVVRHMHEILGALVANDTQVAG